MANPIEVIKKIQEIENVWGDFILNGPGDGVQGHIRDQYRKRCDQFANLPGWARQLSSPATGSLQRACKPYWDAGGFDGPTLEPPFTGGQCDCELYRFDYVIEGTSDQFGGPYTLSGSRKIRGPIQGTSYSPASSEWTITGRSANVALGASNPACGATQTTNFRSIGFPSSDSRLSTFTVTSLATTPGNCGDPPPVLTPGPNPPPDPGPTPGPEPTDDPFGGPVPDLPIPPYDDPIFGPTPIDPGDEPGGGGGPPAGGDGLPGDPESVGDPVGSTGGDGAGEDFPFGTPPAGKIWVGALIEATVDPRYGNIPGTGPDNTVYPYVIGNASLIYATGRSSSSRMRSRWHEIFRPVTALEVTGAFVQCRPGISATVRPVSATICPDNPCEEQPNG